MRPRDSLEDLWGRFLQLDLPDQLQFEGWVLMRRAEKLELSSNQKKVAITQKSATLANALDKSRDNMAEIGSTWSDRELLRVQRLIKESLIKNKARSVSGAIKKEGVNSAAFDLGDLRLLASGSLEQLRTICFTPGLVNAVAAICYEVLGWDEVIPTGLGESTYRNRSEALLSDLANHEQKPA